MIYYGYVSGPSNSSIERVVYIKDSMILYEYLSLRKRILTCGMDIPRWRQLCEKGKIFPIGYMDRWSL